ncbi:MAG TPA: CRTAC1 family protein [Planctomycetaceae bacterium]
MHFEDVAGAAGVVFTYHNGEEAGQFSILESLGGGVAAWDYDADGDLDLFFPGGGRLTTDREVRGLPGALFRNHGAWQFTNETLSAGVGAAPYYSHGATAGDYDGDGFADLMVTGYGGLVLWHNGGDGTLTETTLVAGLTDTLWSTSAAWGDLNNDGSPDLYVAHYVDWSFDHHPVCTAQQASHPRDICPPGNLLALPHILYFSNGDGTFRDGSREAGLRTDGKGLGVVIADLDLDGAPDVYVANDDTAGNFLYRNLGNGRFVEVGLVSGTSVDNRGHPNGSMGVDVGDYNLDGLPDIWVSNFERETTALYRNQGKCVFQHVSEPAGLASVGGMYVGWGSVFFDFDSDGDEDAIVATGHVMQFPNYSPVEQTPLLFENQKGRRLVNVSPVAGAYFQSSHKGRGVSCGDLDGDGDVDLAISQVNQQIVVLSNITSDSRARNWLGLRLIGTTSARQPVGAIVHLTAGGAVQMRQFKGGGSYASSSDPRLFFGIGGSTLIERVEINWPSGRTSTRKNVNANRWLTIIEGGPSE